MELTDPGESADLDSAPFAVHSMHLAICVAGLAFNSLLLHLMNKCSAFHAHMKIIMTHQTMAIMAADVYLLLRSTLGLYQSYGPSKGTVEEVVVGDAQCSFSVSVPDSLCMLFIWFPFLLLVERLYASQNWQSYENKEAPIIFKVLCCVMWLPMSVEVLGFLFGLSLPQSLQACQYTILQQSHMQRNAWFVIIALFSAVFALLFKLLELKNKRVESHSVRNDYVFSCRYQIRENIRTCRFAYSLLLLYVVFFSIFVFFDRNAEDDHELRILAAARREYLFLIFPTFSLIYSLQFFIANSALQSTAKRSIRQFYRHEHGVCLHDKAHIV